MPIAISNIRIVLIGWRLIRHKKDPPASLLALRSAVIREALQRSENNCNRNRAFGPQLLPDSKRPNSISYTEPKAVKGNQEIAVQPSVLLVKLNGCMSVCVCLLYVITRRRWFQQYSALTMTSLTVLRNSQHYTF